MNFQFYVERLQDSDKYKEFIKEHKKAFPCSCFFVLDKAGDDDKQHFDFWDEGKMFSFDLDSEMLSPVEVHDNKTPEEISLELNLDFGEIEDIIEKRMEKDDIKNKIQKYLFSLQKNKDKHYLIGTVFVSNLGMLRVKICVEDKELVEFEKKSFFDVLKIKGKD